MRVAYIINSVEGGGAVAPIPAVARLLAAYGAEMRILSLTRRDGRGLPALLADGLDVRVRPGGDKDHVGALTWLDREVDVWRPQLLWTSLTRATLLGQIIGRWRNVPVASWQHAAYLRRANHMLLRATQAWSAMWIGDSQNVTDLTARRLKVPPARLATWPLFSASPSVPLAKPWEPGRALRVGSLGRLHPVKGYDCLISALTIMKANGFIPPVPVEVEIGGSGASRAALFDQISAAALARVRLVGFVAQPRQFLASLHLYVQPSRSEGLCIAAHEAMESRLPAMVSAVGEMPHTVVDCVTGWVVPPADPIFLAATLHRALSHPDKLAPMGQEARTRILELFGPDAFAAAGKSVLQRLGFIAA